MRAPMRGLIETKSDLLNLFVDVLTTDMPFRNFTLRLYTRMLKLEDNPTAKLRLTEPQQQQMKSIFLSSVQALKKLQQRMFENN